jgi:hypothetical protein
LTIIGGYFYAQIPIMNAQARSINHYKHGTRSSISVFLRIVQQLQLSKDEILILGEAFKKELCRPSTRHPFIDSAMAAALKAVAKPPKNDSLPHTSHPGGSRGLSANKPANPEDSAMFAPSHFATDVN